MPTIMALVSVASPLFSLYDMVTDPHMHCNVLIRFNCALNKSRLYHFGCCTCGELIRILFQMHIMCSYDDSTIHEIDSGHCTTTANTQRDQTIYKGCSQVILPFRLALQISSQSHPPETIFNKISQPVTVVFHRYERTDVLEGDVDEGKDVLCVQHDPV